MRSLALPTTAVVLLVSALPLAAQQLDWGHVIGAPVVDSSGLAIDDAFVFELGAFADGFVPDDENVDEWISNWRVFDRASYDAEFGWVPSTALMNDDGTSASPHAPSGGPSFEGLQAFIWVRNFDTPEEGTEWFLARADDWVFPSAIPGCCDNGTPLDWSVSDLDTGDTPLWGSQGGVPGWGVVSNPGSFTIQTYTFVPEPGRFLMTVMAAALFFRRKRQ